MKSIEAFSWANFGIRMPCSVLSFAPHILIDLVISVLICFLLVVILANRAQSMGRYGVWNESMSFLPWFNQGSPYGYGQQMYGGQQMFGANGQMPYVIQQTPGHSVVIQPNPGGIPTVTQVPGMVGTGM